MPCITVTLRAELLWVLLQWRSSQSVQYSLWTWCYRDALFCSDKARAVTDLVTGTLLSVNDKRQYEPCITVTIRVFTGLVALTLLSVSVIASMGLALQWHFSQSRAFYGPRYSDTPLSQCKSHYGPCWSDAPLSERSAHCGPCVIVTLCSVKAVAVMDLVKVTLCSVKARICMSPAS